GPSPLRSPPPAHLAPPPGLPAAALAAVGPQLIGDEHQQRDRKDDGPADPAPAEDAEHLQAPQPLPAEAGVGRLRAAPAAVRLALVDHRRPPPPPPPPKSPSTPG